MLGICTSSGSFPKFLTCVRGPSVLEERDWASRFSVGWSGVSALAVKGGKRAAVLVGVSVASWLDSIGGDGLENAGLVAEASDDIAGGVRSARNPPGSLNGDAAIVLPAVISDSATIQAACIVRRSSGA